jgi:hypothetical protein
MKKIYVVSKFVIAHSVTDAIEKEKKLPVDNVSLSEYSLGQWAEIESPGI